MAKLPGIDHFEPTDQLPWMPLGDDFSDGGMEWKFIHRFEDGERWTAMYRGPAGSYIRPHIHTGVAEGYQFYGSVQVTQPHIVEGPGFLRESANARHPKTVLLTDASFMLTMTGPIEWIRADGSHYLQTPDEAERLWNRQLAETPLRADPAAGAGRFARALRVLFVLSSHDALGDTGRQTGTWLEELLSPYYRLRSEGIEVKFASPRGGRAPIDPASVEALQGSALLARFEADGHLQAALAHTFPLESVESNNFDGVIYPGGHGPLYDLRSDQHSIGIIESMLRDGRQVGTVCHAGAVLLNARTTGGKPIARGRSITAFTNSEEAAVGLSDVVPYAVEAELVAQGCSFSRAADWESHVVVDRNLITGQNPASAAGVADAMLEAFATIHVRADAEAKATT